VLDGALLLILLLLPVFVGLLVLLAPLLLFCFCLEDDPLRPMTKAIADAALAKLSTPWLTFSAASPDALLLLPPLRFTPSSFPLFASMVFPCGDVPLLPGEAPAPFLLFAAAAAAAGLPLVEVPEGECAAAAAAAALLLSAAEQGAGGLATSSFNRLTMNQPLPPVYTAQYSSRGQRNTAS
jgi:hypothetical protein